MLLLVLGVLLSLLATGSRAQPLNGSCAPATCGDLVIRYPFWLHGRHQSHCGYPTFGVTCDDPTGATPPSLNASYLRVLDIRYGSRSVVASHAGLAQGDPCRATRFNVSSSFALSPLAVSAANWEVHLLSANCSRPEPPPPAARPPLRINCSNSGSGYKTWSVYPVRGNETLPAAPAASAAGCQYSVVPVLQGSELRAWNDYPGIVTRGFLLEWAVPGDCAACEATGGECRYEAGVNAFGCRCPDGRLHPATCGEFSSLIIPCIGENRR